MDLIDNYFKIKDLRLYNINYSENDFEFINKIVNKDINNFNVQSLSSYLDDYILEDEVEINFKVDEKLENIDEYTYNLNKIVDLKINKDFNDKVIKTIDYLEKEKLEIEKNKFIKLNNNLKYQIEKNDIKIYEELNLNKRKNF